MENQRMCQQCGLDKPLNEFTFDKRDGQYKKICKDCVAKKQKQRRQLYQRDPTIKDSWGVDYLPMLAKRLRAVHQNVVECDLYAHPDKLMALMESQDRKCVITEHTFVLPDKPIVKWSAWAKSLLHEQRAHTPVLVYIIPSIPNPYVMGNVCFISYAAVPQYEMCGGMAGVNEFIARRKEFGIRIPQQILVDNELARRAKADYDAKKAQKE